MVIQFGIKQLRQYIQHEEESCNQIKKRTYTKREQFQANEKNDQYKNIDFWINNTEMGCVNQRELRIHSLKEILQELENNDLKLKISFHGPKATDLPHLTKESFNVEGIKLESKGQYFTASMESSQAEFVWVWISSTVSISAGAITIGNFIYEKIQKYKNEYWGRGDKFLHI